MGPGVTHRVLGSTVGTFILILIVFLGAAGIGATGYLFVHTGQLRCKDQQVGWDNRRDAWVALTVPVEYPVGADPRLVAAQNASNAARATQRDYLLAGLGDRPDC